MHIKTGSHNFLSPDFAPCSGFCVVQLTDSACEESGSYRQQFLGHLIKDIQAKIAQQQIVASGFATIAKNVKTYLRGIAVKVVRPINPSS